ncbi:MULTISPECIES: C45 family peptidase [Paenibacillus]|uniref:Peptidase C45 n=1 Tax=Paenibacillus campinasensis TaxID=66347 RepID=A0ABW9T3T5_9BACL|nr:MULTISPECIES: C45 family peptidase [Paenibacillus]MUG67959.1 peptidase C45 [Paenibacillus campinasensis]PAK49653.1 peptidase C45 [Paenibacillus sp. 7541]
MSEFRVRILQLRDQAYNNGVRLGEAFRAVQQRFEAMVRPQIDFDEMKRIYTGFAPHLLEEIYGAAEGLGCGVAKASALLSGYDIPSIPAMGCSALITDRYYVRNYDFTPAIYDGLFTLNETGEAYASAGYNLQGIGRHDGVNEHGLAAGLHFVSFDGYRKGLSPWISVRFILEMCRDVDEASDMLKEIPHAACYNFSLGDAMGNMAVVEASPSGVTVRKGGVAMDCVNHFEEQKGKNRQSIEHSLRRSRYIQRLKTGDLSHRQAFEMFKDLQSPLFFTDYEQWFGTLHTFSYNYEESTIMTALARGNTLQFSFREWMDGRDLSEMHLSGRLERKGE